ncbi:branched-chain amino acid transport system substrate-binding protein [Frankia sp. AiPs1]|uniref:branched-chain amino acid ABC transporter substrate-binding protein n=1 Tax=Frankia sp. AiPa1 TaxID=573492 RepID=UPI00202B01C5|nr:branched-chain amino acid ABC transporter substrate-binding protein [Frankia sp. AiPa1]MCL9761370.1 branched-chain amino acid ABC transporter substrate-binding protein [Frankia sp. AiPa1]
MRVAGGRAGALGVAGSLVAAAVLGGCGGPAGGGGKKEYVLGFQGPLSGDAQQLGINAYDGMLTAVDLANQRPDLQFQLRIVAADDQGDPRQGPTAAQKLIDNPSVLAVVGPVFSGPTKTSEPLYSRAGMLSVSPSATAPDLTGLGFRTFRRVIASDAVQGKAAADYVSTVLKARTVFSLDDRSAYGTGLSTALEQALAAHGINVIHDGINPTQDYTPEATKIMKAEPDVLYYSGYYSELAPLVRALRGQGFTGKIVAGDGSNDDQLIRQAGAGNADGVLLTCACGDPNSDPAASDFVAKFRAVNSGVRPGTYSGEAYDATNAIIDTLHRLGDTADRSAVVTAFGSVNIPGVTKRIAFRKDGNVDGSPVYVFQVRDGKRTVLGPVDTLTRP